MVDLHLHTDCHRLGDCVTCCARASGMTPTFKRGHPCRTSRWKTIIFAHFLGGKKFERCRWNIFRSGPGKPNQRSVSLWTFRRGIPEQKFNVNRACFPKEKHQNSQKWAKFMNFSFWPFLWFGLPGRLLTFLSGRRLECPKWGFKRWGLKQIWGYLRKMAFFLRFLDFPDALCILRKSQGRKNHDSHRRDRIWRDFLHWIFHYFLQILGGSSYSNAHKCWRKSKKSSGEPPVETAPRNCRFLSLVVVELQEGRPDTPEAPICFEQCQVVVFIVDDLGFLGPGSPDLMTELCPPQDTTYPEAPAILFLRSDLVFRSNLIFALPCKRENKIGSKNKIGS